MFDLPSIDPDSTDAQVFKSSPGRALQFIWVPPVMLMFAFLDHRSGISLASPAWILLGLCCGASAPVIYGLWYLLRPVTLIANRSGFTLAGGFLSQSEVEPWEDVDRFLAVSASKRMRVACELRPGAPRYFRAKDGHFDGSTILAGFYPADPGQVADALDALRHRALRDRAEAGEATQAFPGTIADQPASAKAVEPETIRSARWIYAVTFTMILIPGALVIAANIRTGLLNGTHSTLLAFLLIPVMLGALWLTFHPPVLTLDTKGFTLTGGFARSPKTTPWQDVKDFLVYNPPKNFLPMVAYDLQPTAESKRSLPKRLSGFYVRNADDAVNRLNDYRQRALGLISD